MNTPAARPAHDQVLVRMYGQGVGDCFLLAFPPAPPPAGDVTIERRPVYVLIDCGVVAGTPDGPLRMREIVRDIRETTRDAAILAADGQPGGHLDLLIITHEHWDHLSGFVQAREEWEQIQVDALWTAWTESDDPDGLPAVLKRILERQRRALARIADRALQIGAHQHHETALSLMSFLSGAADEGLAFAAAPGVGDALAVAKTLAPRERWVCCEPGEVRLVPGTDVRAYVLGPPRDDARLRQLSPTRRGRETYEATPERGSGDAIAPGPGAAPARPPADPTFSLRGMAEGRSGFNAFTMAALGPSLHGDGLSPGEPLPLDNDLDRLAEMDIYNRAMPFERSTRVPLPAAEVAASDPATFPALASYFDEMNHWRRIDFDWLASAEAFALQADNLTNNTSLVLAFELPATTENGERAVLLFVGDAQVGNWLSWDDIPAWLPRDGATVPSGQPDIADLLRRAVFYKVGHHGSHNATLRAHGVERMRVGGPWTAFVPVSIPVAREIKGWRQMPLETLLDALAVRSGGRVALPNGNLWPPVAADRLTDARAAIGLTVATASLPPKTRERQTAVTEAEVPLWVQLTIDC